MIPLTIFFALGTFFIWAIRSYYPCSPLQLKMIWGISLLSLIGPFFTTWADTHEWIELMWAPFWAGVIFGQYSFDHYLPWCKSKWHQWNPPQPNSGELWGIEKNKKKRRRKRPSMEDTPKADE